MIGTVVRVSVLRLWNNKQELLLVFAVPVIFFSIFALIFSRGVGQSVSRVRVSFVDDDQNKESAELIQAASAHAEMRVVTGVGQTQDDWPIDKLARTLISRFHAEVVVHIPRGFTTQDPDQPSLSIGIYDEGSNPIGHRLVQAGMAESIALQLSAASLQNLGTPPTEGGVRVAAFSSPSKSAATSEPLRMPILDAAMTDPAKVETAGEPQVFKTHNLFASNKHQPKVALVAAGIAVMFLLFSANSAGAGLLEEREAGTLERLFTSQLTLGQLLLGKWLFMTALGCTQLFIMFAWGQLVFAIDLTGHLAGFSAMAVATSSACASFALFLAAISRSRQQLHALSIILVLSMSAVGGSMVPRYIMSDTMRQLGKLTFNGWALDGFQKIFWYDLPLHAIRPELTVLVSMALLLGLLARCFAERWRWV